MIRGTTPTLFFQLPFDTTELDALQITIAQAGNIVVQKTLSDCLTHEREVACTLTEDDTFALDKNMKTAEIQVRAACGELSMASRVFCVSVGNILDEEYML